MHSRFVISRCGDYSASSIWIEFTFDKRAVTDGYDMNSAFLVAWLLVGCCNLWCIEFDMSVVMMRQLHQRAVVAWRLACAVLHRYDVALTRRSAPPHES